MSKPKRNFIIGNVNYKPSTNLEQKALFLEETQERMQSYSDYLFQKIKRLERKGQKPRALKKKLRDVNEGIIEVNQKADVLWKEIALSCR